MKCDEPECENSAEKHLHYEIPDPIVSQTIGGLTIGMPPGKSGNFCGIHLKNKKPPYWVVGIGECGTCTGVI